MSRRLYMLDTNTVSYILKAKSQAAYYRLLSLKQNEAVCMSAVTEAELWYGLYKSSSGPTRHRLLEKLILSVPSLPWQVEAARTYGVFRTKQEAIGKALSPLDTLIAAHAISVGAILVSSDKVFRFASGLPGLENWATDLLPRI